MLIGQFVSAFGSATLAVGFIGLLEFLPMLSVALIGGALADRFERRRLILSVESALVLCCGVLLAGLFAIHRPAMEALMQPVLPVDYVVAGGALNSIRGNFALWRMNRIAAATPARPNPSRRSVSYSFRGRKCSCRWALTPPTRAPEVSGAARPARRLL